MIISPLSSYYTECQVEMDIGEWLRGPSGRRFGAACLVGSSSGDVTQLWSQQLLHKHVGKQCKKEGTTQTLGFKE